jgi:hypothetical protein
LLHNHAHLSSGAGTIGQKWPLHFTNHRHTLASSIYYSLH